MSRSSAVSRTFVDPLQCGEFAALEVELHEVRDEAQLRRDAVERPDLDVDGLSRFAGHVVEERRAAVLRALAPDVERRRSGSRAERHRDHDGRRADVGDCRHDDLVQRRVRLDQHELRPTEQSGDVAGPIPSIGAAVEDHAWREAELLRMLEPLDPRWEHLRVPLLPADHVEADGMERRSPDPFEGARHAHARPISVRCDGTDAVWRLIRRGARGLRPSGRWSRGRTVPASGR